MSSLRQPIALLFALLLCVLSVQAADHPSERQPTALNRTTTRNLKDLRGDQQIVVQRRSRRPARVLSARISETSSIPVVFPPSTCAYTSTGSTPWAVYNGLDINSSQASILLHNIATRDQCNDECGNRSNCIASTYNAGAQDCYLIFGIEAYKPGGDFLVSLRGTDCASNAQNVPASYLAGSTCCTEYRAS